MTGQRPGTLTRRCTLAGLAAGGALAAAGCAPRRPRRDIAEEPRGGIGGTGVTTGIIGTVTGLGSVRLNGLRVAVPDGPAASPLGPVVPQPGHVVEILAGPGPDGADADGLRARRVAVVFALAGPAETDADGALRILGVPVRPEPDAVVPPGGLSALAPARRLAVSGLWTADGVVASRLDPLDDHDSDLVAGVATAGPGGARIGGVPLAGTAGPAPGGFHTVLGRWTGAALDVVGRAAGRPVLAAGPLARLSVEGYLAPEDVAAATAETAAGYAIAGLGAPFDPAARVAPLAEGRAVFIGALADAFRVEHGIPLPEGHAARRAALAAVGDGLAPARGAIGTR